MLGPLTPNIVVRSVLSGCHVRLENNSRKEALQQPPCDSEQYDCSMGLIKGVIPTPLCYSPRSDLGSEVFAVTEDEQQACLRDRSLRYTASVVLATPRRPSCLAQPGGLTYAVVPWYLPGAGLCALCTVAKCSQMPSQRVLVVLRPLFTANLVECCGNSRHMVR